MTYFFVIVFIFLVLFIFIFIENIAPVYIVNKIFNLDLKKEKFRSYVYLLIFFPVSFLFLPKYYKYLKKIEKIKNVKWFLKIISVLTVISISFSIFINQKVIKEHLVFPFQLNWDSMYPTLYNKQFLLSQNITQKERWDIIIFKPYINDSKSYFLKRIIWLPWEKIKIEWWKVYVFNISINDYKELNEPYLAVENSGITFAKWNTESFIYEIPEDNYFLLWDNRNHSMDSRFCFWNCETRKNNFFVHKKDIIWKVYMDLWYLNFRDFSFIHPENKTDTSPVFFRINEY